MTNDTGTPCEVCEYTRLHGWVGPGRHHCRHCHRTWTGTTQVHCVMCHQHFSSPTAGDRHRTKEACQDPALVTIGSGEPALEGRPTKYGVTWFRVDARTDGRILDALGSKPRGVSCPTPDEPILGFMPPGTFRRQQEGRRSRPAAA